MANGASTIHIRPFGDTKTVTATATSNTVGMPPQADEVGLMTAVTAGMASALTVKLQQSLNGNWVDLTGASGTAALDANSSAPAEINFATKPNSGNLRINISAVTLYTARAVASANIANATDNFGFVGHGFVNGVPVTVTTSDTLPTGLALATTYYVQRVDNDNFKLCTTYALATGAGAVVNITTDGVGNQTFTPAAVVIDTRICYGKKL